MKPIDRLKTCSDSDCRGKAEAVVKGQAEKLPHQTCSKLPADGKFQVHERLYLDASERQERALCLTPTFLLKTSSVGRDNIPKPSKRQKDVFTGRCFSLCFQTFSNCFCYVEDPL